MGVRLFGRQRGARAAGAGRRTPVRASENGEVHALDPKTGCTHWTYKALGGVRTGLTVGPYKTATASGQGRVLRRRAPRTPTPVDAQTGRMVWTRKVDDHTAASLTGTPALHAGRLYVPVQGLNEEGTGGRGGYQCCTFRGSPRGTRREHRRRGVEDVHRRTNRSRARRNAQGVQMWGPGGRRHLVGADRRCQARRRLRGDRQRVTPTRRNA
jgi:polyvinyl alcohol dehydrogenase (cytochrome)